MEVQQTYENIVETVKLKIRVDLVDGWKEMETYFQVESALLAVSAADKLLRRYSDVQSSLGMSSALLGSLVTKALDMDSSISKSPSAGMKIPRDGLKRWVPRVRGY